MDIASSRRQRAALVCPGSDQEKILKALNSGADEVVIDLEDAVSPVQKEKARHNLRMLTERAGGGSISVRVNGLQTPWFVDDLRAVAPMAVVTSVIVPKIDRADDIDKVEQALDVAGASTGSDGIGIQALIETAQGLRNVDSIAASGGRLTALIIGYADLGAELGRDLDVPPELWLATQDRVLTAARAAGILGIDGPALYTAADERLRADAARTAALGFDGKWVVHPAQISTVISAFTPTVEAVTNARSVLSALRGAESAGRGAVSLDGMMLDEALAVSARRTLARAGEVV